MKKPLEQILPPAERERLRAESLAREPRFWTPAAHLAATTLFGGSIFLAKALLLRHLTPRELLFGLFVLLFSNVVEWRAHRTLLHRRTWPLPVLYDRHTPEHHMIDVRDDMAMRSSREFRLVLIPAYGIVAIFCATVPFLAALWLFGQRDLAAVFAMSAMLYVVSYEWLHLAYHLPATSRIGSWAPVPALRTHHAIHHDPRLMQRWNFNVTLPLWDLIAGTHLSAREAEAEAEANR